MLGATEVVNAPMPWADIVYVGAAIIAALGAFVAVPMFFYFLKDRQRILLRQEVEDVQRRLEQLDTRVSELTKERDTLHESLADERKRPNVDAIAKVLSEVTIELGNVVKGNGQILEKLTTMNGGMSHAAEALQETNETSRVQTEAVKFLAETIKERFPILAE